ncbi:MAG TPA: radical SAM protein, partial [Prolixibacteraceae bacterium]|nr:radical SAM protein [Prolixibacteraceae bacterium]
MTTFYDTIQQYKWNETREKIYQCTPSDVERALSKKSHDLNDFMALISPAAAPYLEQMAAFSRQLTQKRFGKTIQLYLPLYLSNECVNSCVYCGFNHANKITRKTLTLEEVENEANAICAMGYEHLLLVTGEHPVKSGGDYLLQVIDFLKNKFSQLSVEVQPLQQNEY